MEATSLSSTDTLFSADAIEFVPKNPSIFACGTYQIQKDESTARSSAQTDSNDEEDSGESGTDPTVSRYGRCLLYQVDQDGSNLREIQRFDGAAILDMKWSNNWTSKSTLAIADAKGHVQLHQWDDETKRLSSTQIIECTDEKTLCLSLDWSDRRGIKGQDALVVSISDGTICTLGGESDLQVTSSWHGHDFEPWIAAFDCWEPSTVWTGGDDLKLKGWDLRQGCDRPTFINKRTFEGGVTTIQSHHLRENIFAVGSYDERIRIFDRRSPQTPLVEHSAGGGLWRLKWHPTNPHRLLAAAMHNGFAVVDIDFSSTSSSSLTSVDARTHTVFNGHESLAYGVDWSCGAGTVGERDLVASCSFYDHLVHVWDVDRE
ncbi:WD40 repeat-like protein [Meredithblackwellia eburnea MCA 4105]